MRIYDGAPRQNYEEVLRSIGATLDQRGMREIVFLEDGDGFLVQGLALIPGEERSWNDPVARLEKETLHLHEEDFSRFMDEGVARRRSARPQQSAAHKAGFYETALRVLGAYADQQRPHDVFFFEQEQQFVVRLLMPTRAGLRHVLIEFTREEIVAMVNEAQRGRG